MHQPTGRCHFFVPKYPQGVLNKRGILYTSLGTSIIEELNSFYQKVKLPKLFQEGKDNLEVLITEAEVRSAIMGMK